MFYKLCMLLLAVTLVFSEEFNITRVIGGQNRHCIPIYDCKPGHEVLPCPQNFTHDICQKCPTGYVQPNYTSSSIDKESTCFKPKGQSLGYDNTQCPPGTEKNKTECGPCKHIKRTKDLTSVTKDVVEQSPNLQHKIMVGELALKEKEQHILKLKIKLLKKTDEI